MANAWVEPPDHCPPGQRIALLLRRATQHAGERLLRGRVRRRCGGDEDPLLDESAAFVAGR